MRHTFALALIFSVSSTLIAADGKVLDSMDALSFQQPKDKAKVEVVEGKDGKALKFTFENECRNAFCFSKIKGSPEWDSAAGISFWVKGDGSEHCGGIQFVWNDDFSVRYGYCFPIHSTEWTKVVIPWRDLIPETSNANSKPLGANGNAPSKLGAMWFGKWWYWRDYAAHSFVIDDIRLESTIDLPADPPVSTGLQRVAAKLKEGKPITVVTMGDSLTDYAHWANKPINWPTTFKEKIKEKFKSDVTVINPAMGGTELRQNLIVMPRWLKQAPEPDLVTICFGGNDWNSGMRGEMFQQTVEFAIDRVRRMTHGKADVLVVTTCRGLEHWNVMDELAEACRKAASAKSAGMADVAGSFDAVPQTDREKLYCKDHIHLGPFGHETFAKTVIDALEKSVK